jgi:5-methylcytosine-specific restriction protein A
MFNVGQEYRRRDIHALYGGQEQGGISTPSKHKMIFLFTSHTGEQYGYKDGWVEGENLFLYTGEGQKGDMTFIRGNKAIRDHEEHGREIHLFSYIRSGYVRYEGQMIYSGFRNVTTNDVDGHPRQAIVFELRRKQ